MSPRVRFAPSPTGPFHVGGARTALFNWMFARHEGGEFVLRNEDTDPVRSSDEWLGGILDGLRWLGLEWDGEVLRQSERRGAHVEAAERLVESGHAYWCDCTPEQIQERMGKTGYDGFCRDRGLGPGDDRAVRFRVPDEGTTTVVDLIRGNAAFEHALIDDFVIVRRGGAPMFVLANVLDDDHQGITHVVRGEEHLSTTPRYLLIRQALGLGDDPVFAHLPLLVNEKRQKLSKRRDKVQLLQFRDEGYLAEAMRNYLALLGWSPRDGEEIQPVESMIGQFRLEDVSRAPAFFDIQKLRHVNGEYIRAMPAEEFLRVAKEWIDVEGLEALAPLAQTRVEVLSDLPDMLRFIGERVEPDEASWEKAIAKNDWAPDVLRDALAVYADAPWQADPLKEATLAIGEQRGLKLGKTQAPIRVAVTGRTVGLPLFESLEVLGRDETRARIETTLERIA